MFAPTIKDLEKFYRKEMGNTYEETVGEKAKDRFEQKMCNLSHLDLDNLSTEEWKKHSFGKVECWTDMP